MEHLRTEKYFLHEHYIKHAFTFPFLNNLNISTQSIKY